MTKSTEQEPIDLEEADTTLISSSTWIGTGKQYKDIPNHVSRKLEKLQTLPDEILEKMPSHNLSPLLLIRIPLHAPAADLVTFIAKSWFSDVTPTESPEQIYRQIVSHPPPSKTTIISIEREMGQMWFDGKTSICDPRVKSATPFPFWALTLWRRLVDTYRAQQWCKAAQTFVQDCINNKSIRESSMNLQSVEDVLEGVGSQSTFTFLGNSTYRTEEFYELLRPVMLGDDITEAMTTHLQKRLWADSMLSREHFIAGSRLYIVIEKTAKSKMCDKSVSLTEIANLVREHLKLKVWIPVLQGQHEIAVRVNFEKKTIAYGAHCEFLMCWQLKADKTYLIKRQY